MIKRFFLPNRSGKMQQFVDAMSGSAFHALQDIDERKRPTLRVAPRREQQVNVIWHHHDRIEANSFSVLAQAVSQNQIASRSRQGR
jgi:hypothetical protein